MRIYSEFSLPRELEAALRSLVVVAGDYIRSRPPPTHRMLARRSSSSSSTCECLKCAPSGYIMRALRSNKNLCVGPLVL